jgi:hypothetical protein
MNRFEMGLCPLRERLSYRKIAESLIGKLTGTDMSVCVYCKFCMVQFAIVLR